MFINSEIAKKLVKDDVEYLVHYISNMPGKMLGSEIKKKHFIIDRVFIDLEFDFKNIKKRISNTEYALHLLEHDTILMLGNQ